MAKRSDPGAAHAAYLETRFFGSLDGLRSLCIALVLWHHGTILDVLGAPPRILTRGFTGVDFFFVLSGFLITTLLVREEARKGRFSLTGFYRRRILRIVPVYFLAVTLAAGWWIGVRGQEQWTAHLPYYYAFLANFLTEDIPLLAPMWSLSVEEQYYMLWPLTLLVLPALRLRAVFLASVLGYAVLVIAFGLLPRPELWPPTGVATFLLPIAAYAPILIGSALALALNSPAGFAALYRLAGHRMAAPAALVALLLAWQFLPQTLLGWPAFVMHAIMALLLAALVLREDNGLARVLRWRPVARVGAISYGLYIWHLVGRHVGVEITARFGLGPVAAGWVAMPLYIAAAIAIAEISFRYYETPFLRLKSRRGAGLRQEGRVR